MLRTEFAIFISLMTAMMAISFVGLLILKIAGKLGKNIPILDGSFIRLSEIGSLISFALVIPRIMYQCAFRGVVLIQYWQEIIFLVDVSVFMILVWLYDWFVRRKVKQI